MEDTKLAYRPIYPVTGRDFIGCYIWMAIGFALATLGFMSLVLTTDHHYFVYVSSVVCMLFGILCTGGSMMDIKYKFKKIKENAQILAARKRQDEEFINRVRNTPGMRERIQESQMRYYAQEFEEQMNKTSGINHWDRSREYLCEAFKMGMVSSLLDHDWQIDEYFYWKVV